jgi:hypothetical protein
MSAEGVRYRWEGKGGGRGGGGLVGWGKGGGRVIRGHSSVPIWQTCENIKSVLGVS